MPVSGRGNVDPPLGVPGAPGDCAHELIAKHAGDSPDALALVFEDGRITYRELIERASDLARALASHGVGPNVLVGLCVERSLDMIVGVVGVWMAGGAYVPLGPNDPLERLRLILGDAQPPVILTQGRLRDRIPAANACVIDLDRPLERGVHDAGAMRRPTPDDLAYVIYTSGSTGVPKGVLVPHRGLAAVGRAQARALGIERAHRIAQFSSLNFDASVFDIVMALTNGATLVLGTRESLLPGPNLMAFLREQAISHITLPPTALAMVPAGPLPELQSIAVAGEVCPERLVTRWAPGRRFFNLYGPTEATIWATFIELREAHGDPPIGGAIDDDVQVHVLDEHLQPVPDGERGELFIGGRGVARGYLRRASLTAHSFVPDPFGSVPGARLYRTGDLARRRADGDLEFLGRADAQVKIRGHRLELGEIESVLARHPGIRQVAVLARGDGVKRSLVGYVVPTRPEDPVSASALRAHTRRHLPDYMVPVVFVSLEAMPVLSSGKIDRSALPAPGTQRPETGAPYVAPCSAQEERLVAIWQELLGFDQIGTADDFFDMGGHSLLVTQLVNRVRDEMQLDLQQTAVFEHPTIAALARILDRVHDESNELPPLRPVSRDGELPVSFAQARAWFLQRLAPASLAYQAQATLRFEGRLDVDALRRSLDEIVRRHEIFRTTFPEVDGGPVQRVHAPWAVELPVIEVDGEPGSERDGRVERLVRDEVRKQFDASQLPLVRWTLLRLGPEEHLLVHVEQHMIHDGWSFSVFLGELEALYDAFARGESSPLPEPALQFVDFAIWQRDLVERDVTRRQLDHWAERLTGCADELRLPFDRPRPKVQSFRGGGLRRTLSPELVDATRELGREQRATLFMTMLAAFVALLHRYSGQDDIIVGSGFANRRSREAESLIGMIINTVGLRTRLEDDPTVTELLERVRAATLEAQANQDVPFDMVVDAVQPNRVPGRNPLFQAIFGFHDSPLPDLEFPDLTVSINEALSNGSAKFDLGLVVIPRAEQRSGRSLCASDEVTTLVWEYSTDLFDAPTIERLADHYEAVLRALVEQSNRRVSELSILADAERQQILEDWNETSTPYPRDACVHRVFEARAAQTPDAIAAEFGGESLTYDALNRRANQVAHRLIGLGVGPEVMVGIAADRSIAMVVAILGVLKAGGAYVPLDPGYPPARLAFMMQDTQAPVVLTQSSLATNLPEHEGTVLCLDTDWSDFAREPDTNPAVSTTAASLAYVMYTSGSTGRPKGVCVLHRAICRLVLDTDYVSLGPADRISHMSNVSFDAATFEIWGALLNGGCLVAIDRDVALAPDRLGAALRDQRISVMFVTTALFNQLAEVEGVFASLRCVLFGGEAVDPGRVRAVLAHGAPEHLLHVYGPTENTTFSTWHEVDDVAADATTVPIGRPIANTTTYVLDAAMNPVPIGVPGELFLGGDGLAHAYLDRPELTAERFVSNPFSGVEGSRLYRTGDLVRQRASGDLEFVGRVDHQVKLRGFRIELGEIETAIQHQPGVRDAVVLCREDTPGDKRLVAYVTADSGTLPPPADLRRGLGERLPEYMIPSAFVPTDAFPLTVNGKTDRAALPAPDDSHLPHAAYVAPSSETQSTVAAIWRDVLRQDRIGVHDNFFDLGGHSLLATRAVSRMRDAFGLEIPLSRFFDEPTVLALAEYVDLHTTGATDDAPEAIMGEMEHGEL